jgi:hypothetical protein
LTITGNPLWVMKASTVSSTAYTNVLIQPFFALNTTTGAHVREHAARHPDRRHGHRLPRYAVFEGLTVTRSANRGDR